jgi:hypothetical protein
MPKKKPPVPPDVAPLALTGTPVKVEVTTTPVTRAPRTIHERRPAPRVPKGETVADAAPSAPVAIERPTARPPGRSRRRRP